MRETSVMALDVVGFSKLMGDNPEITLEALSDRRKIIHDIISSHEGRVFNEAGDSIVSEFPSNEAPNLERRIASTHTQAAISQIWIFMDCCDRSDAEEKLRGSTLRQTNAGFSTVSPVTV